MARYTINLSPAIEESTTTQEPPEQVSPKPEGRYTINMEPEEGLIKSGIRTALQGAKYFAGKVPGVMAHQMLNPSAEAGRAEALNDVEQMLYEGHITQEQYEKAAKDIQEANVEGASPTLQNLYNAVESTTGIPLTAKNKLQKNIEFGSEVAGLSKGGPSVQALTGLMAGAGKEKLEDTGLPTWLTDPVIMAASLMANKRATTPKMRNTAPPPPPREAYQTSPYATPPGGVAPQKGLVPAGGLPQPIGGHALGSKIKNAVPPLQPPPTEARDLRAERFEDVKYGLPPDIAVPTRLEPPKSVALPKDEALPTRRENRPPAIEEHNALNLYNSIGNAIISRASIDDARSGKYLVETLPDISSRVLAHKNELYDQAERLNTNEEVQAPKLVDYLLGKEAKLERIPEGMRSSVDRALLSDIQSGLRRLNIYIGDTRIPDRLLPIHTNDLYEWIKSLSKQVDFDFQDTHPTKVFGPLITQISNQIEEVARNRAIANNPSANPATAAENDPEYQAIKYANWFYKNKWAEPFLNTKVIPYRDSSRNTNAVKLWKEATNDIDTFRALQPILNSENLPEGRSMARLAKRSLVQNMFVDFIKNPEKIRKDPIEYDKKLREIRPLLTDEEYQQITSRLDEASQAQVDREQKVAKREEEVAAIKKAEAEENKWRRKQKEAVSKRKQEFLAERTKHWKISNAMELKIHEMTPEQVAKHASTISGLRDIGYVLSKQPKGPEIFDIVKEAKLAEVLYGGKEEATPQQILDVLKDVEKREFVSEIIGDVNTRLLLQRSKDLLKLVDLTQKRTELLHSIKVPPKWRDRADTWEKKVKEIFQAVRHPKLYAAHLVTDFLKKEMSTADIIKQNQETNRALVDVLDQIEKMSKEQD